MKNKVKVQPYQIVLVLCRCVRETEDNTLSSSPTTSSRVCVYICLHGPYNLTFLELITLLLHPLFFLQQWRCFTTWFLGDWGRSWQHWRWAKTTRTESIPHQLSIPSRTITFSFTLSWWVPFWFPFLDLTHIRSHSIFFWTYACLNVCIWVTWFWISSDLIIDKLCNSEDTDLCSKLCSVMFFIHWRRFDEHLIWKFLAFFGKSKMLKCRVFIC